MPIPSTDEMVLPVLQHIADGEIYRRLRIINMITERFSLTEDERRRLSDGVTMERPLEQRGLIERPRTGYYRITDLGLEYLNQNSEEIRLPDRNTENRVDSPASSSGEDLRIEENTPAPEELVKENYRKSQEGLAVDLLKRIKDNTPTFFEKLVIDLLVKMGYGGSREDAGRAVGRSGDGGIDGIINEDRLGLDVIYVQAKRWESNIGEPPLRDFVGALDGRGVQKGVFITTSNFTPTAKNFAERSSKRIILIDGKQLAQLMIDHNVGVSVEKTYEIKRVDSDYFAENTENS